MCAKCLASPEPLSAEFFCASCRTPFLNDRPLDENGLCGLCRHGMRGFDTAYAFGIYDGPLRALIHLFKYDRIRPLAEPLGELIARAVPLDERFDAVAPMPMHWLKKWRRGFNQAELLADAVARRLSVPVLNAVRKNRATQAQAGLTSAMRRSNVAGAFEVRRGPAARGLRVLLIDDVLTTGATASACAAALKRAGAVHVGVLTLARADRRSGRTVFASGLTLEAAGAS